MPGLAAFTMRLTRPILRALAALPLIAAARAFADGPYVSASASATWQDNITNATAGDGVLGAFTLESGADVTWLRAIDFSTILTTGAAASADLCTTFGGLDCVSVGPRLELRHKIGLGPYAPTVSVGLEADAVAFSDPERSNVDAAVVARFSQRFDESLQLVVDGRICGTEANHEVFSGDYASLGATLNWDMDETWRLSVTGGWRDGAVVPEYAAEKVPVYGWVPIDMGAYSYTGARQLVRTFSEPFIAYRATAPTASWGAGVSPAVGRHTSIVLQYTRCRTSAYDTYVNDLVSVGVVHHF
jgi:hypothetical protein